MATTGLARLVVPSAINEKYALAAALFAIPIIAAVDRNLDPTIPLNLVYVFPLALVALHSSRSYTTPCVAAFSFLFQIYVLASYGLSRSAFLADTIMIAFTCLITVAAMRAIRRSYFQAEALAGNAKLATALESMTDAVFIVDAASNLIDFNEAFVTFYRFRNRQECAGKQVDYPNTVDVMDLNGKPCPLDQWAVSRALRGESATNVNWMLRLKSTGETWIGSYSFAPIRNESYAIIGAVITSRDITAQTKAEEQLREAHDLLSMAERSASAGSWEWNLTTNAITWSPELYELFGLNYQNDKASFATWRNVLHPDDALLAEQRIRDSIEKHTPLRSTYRIRRPDGNIAWVDVVGSTSYDKLGTPLRMAGICIDITYRRTAEQKLKESEANYRAFFENVAIGAAQLDRNSRYIRVNPAFCAIVGYTSDEIVGKMTPIDIDAPEFKAADQIGIGRLLKGEDTQYVIEKQIIRKDGVRRWVQVVKTVVEHDDSESLTTAALITDITDRKSAEASLVQSRNELQALNLSLEAEVQDRTAALIEVNRQLDKLAHMDALTGILNRMAANERLRHEYVLMKRTKQPYAVLMIDIDHFKVVNDTHGHEVGDRVLQEIAQQLRKELRESDFVARFGGEEFIAVLPATEMEGGLVVASKLRQSIEDLWIPGVDRVTVSIGVSVASSENASQDVAVNEADSALYEAKAAGRNRVMGYSDLRANANGAVLA